jgi:aminoglycoside 6'-N-acetyltransferase I
MSGIIVRHAKPSDCAQLAHLRAALWPDSSPEEHARELETIVAGHWPGILRLIEVVATRADGTLVGFAEVGLRSYVDGCDVGRPVGYVEGWFVVESCREQAIGAQLLAAAEDWARTQGCTEMASDCDAANILSQRVHEALGFEVTSRSVNYRKKL